MSTTTQKIETNDSEKKYCVVCQKWEESERGWGTRPDGYTLHLSHQDVKTFIDAYWDTMPDEVPDEYSRPFGTPYYCIIDEPTMARLKSATDKCGIWGWDKNYPAGGVDGWIQIKNL